MNKASAYSARGVTIPGRQAGARDLRHHLLRLTLGTLLPVVLIAAVGAVVLAIRERGRSSGGVAAGLVGTAAGDVIETAAY